MFAISSEKNCPDMSHIENCFTEIYKYLRKNQTIILESSVYTELPKIFLKKINKKFKLGKKLFLCYSPERIDPGKRNIENQTAYKNITKLISGHSNKCLKNKILIRKSI